ncbi:hypothetical protein GGX14DRAFT_393106 [Mycena pura]|uniref:Uncharacterized protein n=1 Tax=Mycena pura TaxID=153505 RepID=A0AAD6VM81_9AGAR|nr:hypothetical protein GGX14DRAFT_393106 [Mycena pura]
MCFKVSKTKGNICKCQKYNAGVAKAGGLGRNHELRSAGARARKGHRGRAEDKDVKKDRLDFLCDATDPVYKEEDTVDGERKNQSKERVCTGSHRMEHTKGYERTKAYPEPKNSDPDLNQTWLPSPSPRDPGRDTKNQIVEQSQQPTQAKSVSKHEWLQSPSPQDSKITEGRWGAVNELNSHTVRQRLHPKDSGSASSEPRRENIPKESEWIGDRGRRDDPRNNEEWRHAGKKAVG